MKGKTLSALAVSGMLGAMVAASPAIANDTAAMMAETCAGCHGTDGSSNGPVTPSIAGVDKEYFVTAMKDYASGARPSTVMGRIAKGYTEADYKAMADYFASRKMVLAKQTFDPALAAKGKDLQARFCENCHEKGGTGGELIPKVAGQWTPYLQYSLADFKSGVRTMERRKKAKMEELMAEAGDDGLTAILHYLASQQ
ncbi:c-type cytochrome [Novispirillum sp. DQ9]|uniref:c-type cytochrome n=1 Tax=Novispirillum sp. DQ9 TaxID=3398612 RepID=UPI003C7A8BCF